ncbi:hypothetical protein F0562_002990 [Nyssa sinensis]|uniref:Uncharacterized protein n=1 Tax=Nyssa sinensis TaxID=561372 RepID=A0A5J5BYD4_9ASTE|nr:hypothetical protein F0562_002990 [Nyssa sinensis]
MSVHLWRKEVYRALATVGVRLGFWRHNIPLWVALATDFEVIPSSSTATGAGLSATKWEKKSGVSHAQKEHQHKGKEEDKRLEEKLTGGKALRLQSDSIAHVATYSNLNGQVSKWPIILRHEANRNGGNKELKFQGHELALRTDGDKDWVMMLVRALFRQL